MYIFSTHHTHLAMSESASSLLALGAVALVLLGCCCNPSSSLAAVVSVSSLCTYNTYSLNNLS